MKRVVVLLPLLLLATACPPRSTIPNPLDGQSRYLCCNLHYEKTTITDVDYQVGTMVPLGTRVVVTRVDGDRVTFEAPGAPPLTVVLKYGRRNLDMDTFVGRLLVAQDPRAKLARMSPKIRTAIEHGVVEPGMTREQVLMSLGYPPAHRTPSLTSPQWIYWQNRWASYVVSFEGDKVAQVMR